MTVHSENLRDTPQQRSGIVWNRVASAIAWLLGTFTTYLFFARAMPEVGVLVNVVIAALGQWLLTIAERPLWRFLLRRKGGRFVALGLVVTLFDGLLNAGGLYPYMTKFAATDVGKMIAEVLKVEQAMTPTSAFLLAFLLGVIVAGLPEYLWESS